jgi:glycosyltransferase involved in cell wall biosynthesis/cellulose synthase/poly-beta-1,6-N-acetylglucosamine synthase-like glycosyltransferase
MTPTELVIRAMFWLCMGGIAYAYVGYPVLVWALASAFGRRRDEPGPLDSARSGLVTGAVPSVAIVIVAHNEEVSIGDRLANALAIDYPVDRLEIVVASDGSTDRTGDIVVNSRDRRVRLVDFSSRRGKAAVLNDVIPTLTAEIVVLSDANTSMQSDAVRRLARWFGDRQVGVVVGCLVLADPKTGHNVDGLYWKYETFLKRMDARLDALVGANGAIYAIRRSRFVPIPCDTLVDDLVLPLLMRLNAGCDIVYDQAVLAFEETAADVAGEFKRRRRIGAGGFQSLRVLWPLLWPSRGWIAFTFLSHKVLRWLCPFLLLGALALNLPLAGNPLYRSTLWLQALLYVGACAGAMAPGSGVLVRLLRLATMFACMNGALLAGFWQWVGGAGGGAWERTARTPGDGVRALANVRPLDRPIRIVHIVIGLEIGGLEMVVANLARQIGSRFHLHVICLEGLGPIAARVEHARVFVECIGRPDTSMVRSILTLRRRLKALRPDVIHTHNEKAHIRGAIATLAARWAPAIVHTRHGESRASGLAALANRLAVWRSGFVISVSEQASAIARAEGAPAHRVRVIRNGIDVNRRGVAIDDRPARTRVVAIGRLTPVKDLPTLLRAVRMVADTDPAFQIDVVGDGPSRPALERLRRELGLERHVTFHGAREDVHAMLSEAQLFVQSSLSEGISLTLLEAMAAGVPIVATGVGGTPEVVDHGVTGLLVSPARPERLAAAMLTVLNDRGLAQRMGAAARERAEQHFNILQMAASYEALYEEATARPGVRAA